mgnify:CR=1 FL=1
MTALIPQLADNICAPSDSARRSAQRALAIALTLSAFGSMASAQSLPVNARAFTITHYDVELRPQLDARIAVVDAER